MGSSPSWCYAMGGGRTVPVREVLVKDTPLTGPLPDRPHCSAGGAGVFAKMQKRFTVFFKKAKDHLPAVT
jgi:hypothetical protein